MRFLYTNTPSYRVKDNQQTILDAILEQMSNADRVEIAVGYASKASLKELDTLVEKYSIKYIILNIGMYYTEGMPEQMHNVALSINEKWKDAGIGEIRIIKTPKYHGKMYLFFKDDLPFSAIVGSANLSVLKPDASTRMQYETAVMFGGAGNETHPVLEIKKMMDELTHPARSANIADISSDEMKIVRTLSDMLEGEPYCESLPSKEVDIYRSCISDNDVYHIELKVPTEDDIREGRDAYMGSNINVCYAKARQGEGIRNWYEVQVHLPADFLRESGIKKYHPFYVCTDDGYWFKVWNTSGGPLGKQMSTAGGGDRVLGKWLKGRLVAAGLVEKPKEGVPDTNYSGAITKEMLQRYGCTTIMLAKTGKTAPNDERMTDEELVQLKAAQDIKTARKKAALKLKGQLDRLDDYINIQQEKTWLYYQDELPVWYMSFSPEDNQ